MSAAIHIRNVRIIDPSAGSDSIGDLFLQDGVIVASSSVSAAGARIIDGTGLVAAPGFVDLHTHLREPGFEDKETIETGTAAGARGGFTTLCCMPNTSPAIDTAAVVDFIGQQARLAGPVRVLSFGAVTRGRAGEELADMEELA
ncbi:MAG: amidohydrolase family protein, partial [Dehalococcoidia bacterium]